MYYHRYDFLKDQKTQVGKQFIPSGALWQLPLANERLFCWEPGRGVLPGHLSELDKQFINPHTMPMSTEAGGIVICFSQMDQSDPRIITQWRTLQVVMMFYCPRSKCFSSPFDGALQAMEDWRRVDERQQVSLSVGSFKEAISLWQPWNAIVRTALWKWTCLFLLNKSHRLECKTSTVKVWMRCGVWIFFKWKD